MFPIDDLYKGDEPMYIDGTAFGNRKTAFADEETRQDVLDSSLYEKDSVKLPITVFFSREAIKTLIGDNMPDDAVDRSDVKGLTLTVGLQANDTTLNLMARSADGNGACPTALQDLNYAVPEESGPNDNPIDNTLLTARSNNFRADGYPILRGEDDPEFIFSNQILFDLLYEPQDGPAPGDTGFYFGINNVDSPNHLTIVANVGEVYREGKPCPPNCYG